MPAPDSDAMTAPAGDAKDVFVQAAMLLYPDRPSSSVDVQVRHRDARQRTTRALATLAACWGLAIVAVFLPLLHFILVPGLLVLGPVLAWSRWHEGNTLLSATGPCPGCEVAQRFSLGQPWRERTMLRCESCGRRLELRLPAVPPDRS